MKNALKLKSKKTFLIFFSLLIILTVFFSMHLNSNNKKDVKVYHLRSRIFAEGGTATGWQLIDGDWYYVLSPGVYKIGWNYSDGNWYYFDTDGKMVTGIKYVPENSAYYYFSEKESTIGIMQTGWRRSQDDWYYLNSDGKAKVNEWYDDGGYYYYFKEDGKVAKGITYVPSDDEYYFLSTIDATYGKMEKSQWVEYYGDWYYINDDGTIRRNDWKSSGSDYLYYFDDNGKMATGFREISGNTYYFSKRTNDGTKNNVVVHIKNQTDLNNYLSTTGQNILGDRVYFENTSNIQFPANSVYYLDISSDGLAGGDYATFWYISSKSTGNIDFNSSAFLIGDETALYTHVTGNHQNQQIKNGKFFGSVDAEYSGGKPYANRGNFNADIIHASNITFKNLEFNNVQEVEDHVLDVMGSDHLTFDNLTFRGFLNDYSYSELSNVYYHYGYKEAIQIDVSNSSASGISDLDKTPIFNNDLVDGAASSNITITNSYFGPYNGSTGQDIIDKSNSTTIRPYGPTIGSHVKGYDYEDITITNNTFADTFCISDVSDKKYLYPIHLMPVLDGYTVSDNTFINECGYSGSNGASDSWETKGFYSRNDSYSSGNDSYDDDSINSTPIDTSSIKAKVVTQSYSYGSAQTGFIQEDSNTYYFRTYENQISTGPKASMVLGLAEIDNNVYYFRETADSNGPKGSMVKGECKTINNKYYCFDSSGVGQSSNIVTIPTTSNCLTPTYDGNPKTLASSQTGYTLSNNSGTNAGNYTVTASLSSGYVWSDHSTSNKSFNCSIAKATLQTPTIINYSGTYDASSHQISLTNSNGKTVYYSTDGITYSTTIPSRTNAGTTTVYVKYVGNNNYNDSSVATGTIEISKANPVITKTNEYNEVNAGYEGRLLSISSNIAGMFTFSTTSSKLNILTGPTLVDANEILNVNISAISDGNASINISFVPQDSTNYNGYQDIKNLTINEQIIVNKVAIIPNANDYCKNNLVYDGNEKYLTNEHGEGYTFINNKGTNAGTYTVSAVLDEHYEWSDSSTTNKTFDCTISKADLTSPSVTSYNGVYDGSAHQVSLSNSLGKTVNYSTDGTNYSSTVPTRVNAGVTTVYVKYLGDDNYNDSAVSTGTITINKDKAPIYHSNPDATFIYGEEGTTFRVSTNMDGIFIFSTEGDNFEIITGPVNVNASQGVDVIIRAIKEGTSTLRVQFIPSDTDNYDSSVLNQDITVHSKPVSEPTSNYCASYIAYDGLEHTLTKDPGEGYTFINNKGTNAGTYTVTAHLKDGYTWYGNSKEDVTFDCTIYKVDGEDFTVTNYSGTYDKKPHGITVTPVSTGIIKYKYGDSDWQTEPFTFTDAGYYSVYVKAFGDQNHKDSDLKTGTISIGYAAPNVEFNMIYTSNITQYSTKDFATGTADLPGTYTFSVDDEIIDNYPTSIHANANETVTFYARGVQVGETSLHMTFQPDDNNYQSAAKNFGIVVWPADENVDIPTSSNSCLNNVVYNETSQVLTTSNTVAYEFINNTGINAGNYNVTVRLKNNYKWSDNTIEDKTITCSIKKADLSVPTINGYTGTYDGNAHTITVSDIPGATIKYSLDNENFTTFVPSRTDVGTTKVYVKYIGDNNHNDSSVYAANITINKANSVISSANLADNIYKGDTLNIGPITANVSGIFTISTANASVLNVPVLARSVNANEEITTTITGSSVGNTSYTITFTPSSSNYNQSSVTTNVTVSEKPKTSVVIPNSTTHCKTNLKYTGSPLTITNNPSTGYTFTNNVQTNAGTYTVTAKLQDGYIWSDNTLTDKTFSCTILKADSYLNFNESYLVVNNGYVKPRTSADIIYSDLKSMIDTNGVLTTNKNDDELVATCDKFTITFDDIINEYLVIITGDVTKSGNVGNGDVNLLFRYLRNKESLNECQLKAADTTSDNEIHINDVAKIYQFIHLKIDRLGE